MFILRKTARTFGHSPLFLCFASGSSSTSCRKHVPKMDPSGYPALEGGKTSSDGDLGVCKSQCHWRLGVRINANTQQAGQMDTLGSRRTSSQDACQSAVLVTRAAILQDAHRMSCSSTWHIWWARASVTVRGADTATSTLNFCLNLIALARRLLIMACARRTWRGWRRWRTWRRWRRWAAGHHGVGGLRFDATLTRAWLATLQLHEAFLAPCGTPAVLHLISPVSHPQKKMSKHERKNMQHLIGKSNKSREEKAWQENRTSLSTAPASSQCHPQFRSQPPTHHGPT